MNPPKNSILVNVCAIPPKDIGTECVAISQSLRSGNTAFVLDGKSTFPHVTLYMARFSDQNINHVVAGVERLLGNWESFPLHHTGYFLTAGRYFEASYGVEKTIATLQDQIINAVSDLRLNPGEPHVESYYAPYNPVQKRNAEQFGYDLAYILFRPHVTLTRYHEGCVPAEKPKTPGTDLSFLLQTVGVYKADDNGAVYEKLAEFNIG